MKTNATTTALQLTAALRQQIARCAIASYPAEACGLLLGRQDRDTTEVVEVGAVRNLAGASAGDRYELDPADHLAAHERAHVLGLDVVGVWHSHPDHAARPSETDRAQAWANWSYVIISVDSRGAREMRSWRLIEDRFHEEEVSP